MEEALWKSADKLRGSVEPAEYKHVVLSIFFLKFASDKFEAQRKAIAEKYGEDVYKRQLFDRIVDKNLLVRRMYVVANHVLPEADAPKKNDGRCV